MGIQVEFNPDLALRAYGTEGRLKEECLPERLEEEKEYDFLKQGQRNYWLEGEIPLLETKGQGRLSRPLASIIILESTHFKKNGKLFTKGKYLVKKVFDINDKSIKFEGFNRVR